VQAIRDLLAELQVGIGHEASFIDYIDYLLWTLRRIGARFSIEPQTNADLCNFAEDRCGGADYIHMIPEVELLVVEFGAKQHADQRAAFPKR
jgi:hypothetical protein